MSASRKAKRISKETLDVYSPIAHRLGINTIKSELEDLALYYLDRPKYELISILLSRKESERNSSINKMIERIESLLSQLDIPFTLSGRAKSIYSIYKKIYVKIAILKKYMIYRQLELSLKPRFNAMKF